jgi:hypothetical protein
MRRLFHACKLDSHRKLQQRLQHRVYYAATSMGDLKARAHLLENEWREKKKQEELELVCS